MKKAFFFSILTVFSYLTLAQVPESFNYQAVVRDGTSNNPITNQSVSFRISILKGSISGSEEYVETHNTSTNSLGLVTLAIGGGIIESGAFTTIDWSADTYFLKVEIDKTGGSSYVEMGTTQLLSVPYAMHAKTAETVTDGITETDPVFTDWDKSTGISITESQITNLDHFTTADETDPAVTANFDFTDAANGDLLQFNGIKWVKATPDYISDYTVTETDVTAHEAALTVTESQISDLGTYIETESDPTVTTYSIGDFAQGGIVFWVDETGQHGLAAAMVDQDGGSGIQWYNGSFTDTEAHGDGVYAGEMNTMLIIANQGSNSNDYAPGVCANYTVTESGVTFGDWYLPSEEELNLMYQNRATIDATAGTNGGSGFTNTEYWSSSEVDLERARIIDFAMGGQTVRPKMNTNRVRAIRAF